MTISTAYSTARRRLPLHRIIAAFVTLLCVATVAMAVLQMAHEKEADILRSGADTSNLAGSLAQQAQDTFRAVDASMIGVVERLEGDGIGPEMRTRLHGVMADIVARLPALEIIGIFDEKGVRLGNSAEREPAPVSVAERAYFEFHKSNDSRALRIDMPVKGKSAGRWIIPLTRRFNHPDGSFAGVVVSSLYVEYFEKFYGGFAIGQQGVATLFSDAGQLMVHYPPLESAANADMSHRTLFTSLLPKADRGSFAYTSILDGIERLASYSRVPNYPLVILVSLSREEVLAPWLEHARDQALVVFLEVGVMALLGIFLVRHVRRSARAEEAVAQIARDYRLMADNSSDLISRMDMNSVRRYVSPACREILGYAPEELVGKAPVDMIHPEDAPAVAATHAAMAAGVDRAVCTNRIRHRDGHWIWAEVKLQLVRDDKGAPFEILGVLRDVTTRKLGELAAADAAQRLVQANEMLRRAEKIAQIGHWRVDLVTKELFWSEEIFRIYGLPPTYKPTVGAAIAAYHPDDRALVAAALEGSIADRKPFSLDVRLIRSDGEVRHVSSNGECDCDGQGRVVAVTGTFQDITDRKVAEEERRRVEKRLALVLQGADLATWRMDFVTGTREVNDRYLQLADLTPDEFDPGIGALWKMLHPDDVAPVKEAVAVMMAERGAFFEQEMRVRQRDGSFRWVLSRGALVEWDRFGGAKVAYGTMQDISERRQLSDALASARDAADQANRAKSEFLAAMSHEIRTPMTGVIGFADLLLDSKLTAEQRRQVTMLRAAGNSLLAIINDILDMSKVEAGKLRLERIPLDLPAGAEGALSLLRPQAVAKGLALSLDLAPDLPTWMLGDPTRLGQILLNLLGNAVKFTEAGRVCLSVSRETAADGEMVRFEVRDTGPGIRADRLDRLFQAFSQVDRSISRRYGGTGLGLVICRHLVEAMGGTIGVVSQPGVGSSFRFSIPLVEAAAPDLPRSGDRRVCSRGARILVADDIAMNQIIVEAMLTAEGHEVTLVSTGVEAVQAVRDSDFDLIFMDMQMPEMDGLAATRIIRGMGERVGDIPIIALTANAMAEDASVCRAAGMNDHVSKPVDRRHLLKIVEDWSGREVSSGRRAQSPPSLAGAA